MTIEEYSQNQTPEFREICVRLQAEINEGLPKAESKVWHGGPVWFLGGNPIVGYWARKSEVRLLFWSGQSFDEPGLRPEGTFKAAEARYRSVHDVNSEDIGRWLKKAETIQWDYKNIAKRRGILERLPLDAGKEK